MTCKVKECMHCKATFVKGTGYFINKDFSKEMRATTKKNWIKSKTIEK